MQLAAVFFECRITIILFEAKMTKEKGEALDE
jgi:hypothetical protein